MKPSTSLRRLPTLSVTLCLLAAMACDLGNGSGSSGDDPADGPAGPADIDFECDPSLTPDELPLRRLSASQHRSAIRDFVVNALPISAIGVVAEIQAPLEGLVPDNPAGPVDHFGALSRLDQTVSQAHIDRVYEVAQAVGQALTTGDRLNEVAGTCAPTERACLEDAVARLGAVALRRPLSQADIDHYTRAAVDSPLSAGDWADTLTLLLLAPEHLYLVETPQADDSTALDAHSLAARLAFHIWQSPPDAELRALADSGELLNDATYTAQVDRLFADPRAAAALREFYGEWLGNTYLEPFDGRLGAPAYDAFLDGFRPSSELHQHMLTEVTDSALYYTLVNDGSWDDLLTSDRSFAKTEELASIYETPVWDGVSDPPTMTQPERAGLFTRAGFVATGSLNSRPIMKGAFLRQAILCEELPPPPDNVADETPDPDPLEGTRDYVERITGSGTCSGCHNSINGLGFPSENFDALGRVRTTQPLFDTENGEHYGDADIRTEAIPYIDGKESVADAHDLTALLVASPKPRACLTRHWFRFTFGRMEDDVTDGCALDAVDNALDEGGSLRGALRNIALSPAFRHRTLTAE